MRTSCAQFIEKEANTVKIIAYGARIDEIPYMQQWAKETGNTLTIHEELLDASTVDWAKGYEGVNALQTTPYSAEVFAKLHEFGIHYLAVRNVGTDNIDLAAAAANDVKISNVPAYSPAAIAEFAVTLTLQVLRRVGEVAARLQADDYDGATKFIGRELGQQTVGVIGAGRIGRTAIRIFEGFGAKVQAYDPYPVTDQDHPIDYVGLDELLRTSDVIDLHIPGIPANTHIIDSAAIASMKPNAVLINTARGNLVDTEAMVAALREHRLAGAGIDTYEHETADLLTLSKEGRFHDPLWDELLAMPNVVLTPHIAYYTETAVHNMVYFSLQHLVDFLTTGTTSTEVKRA